MKKLILIFILCSSIYGNKSGIGFYKNGKMIVKPVIEKEENQDKKIMNTKNSVRDKIIDYAESKLGAKYVWGATGPNTFDCSGFVQYVYKKSVNMNLPRVSTDQADYKPRVSLLSMKKGDLVFFETTEQGRISHVGIYMGEKQFIHASSGGKRVMISSLDTDYYNKSFRWGVDPFI
mgnify:FL=1